MQKVVDDVSSGQFLASSLAKFKHTFGDFAINIIRVGESSGILEQNLVYLSDELKKKQALRQKVVAAFIYPIFITIATVGLTVLLTIFIFPKIRPIFDSMHVVLPLSTKILIFVSDFLLAYWAYFFGSIFLCIALFFVAYQKFEPLRFFLDRQSLRVPLVGKIIQNYGMANISRTLGLLLKSGIRVIEAIDITAETTGNLVYKKELHHIAKEVFKGEKISKYFEKRPDLFPDIFSQMVAIGERTGNLPETLIYLSELHESDVEDLTKNLSSSIEPVLMLFMGFMVGFVAVSVITPIYEITQNLKR